LSMGQINSFKQFLGGFGFTGNAGLDLPASYGVGAKFAVARNVDILADYMYEDWGGVQLYKFFGWKSEPVLKIGAEYRPTRKWALRVGYNYGKSPI
ncbi:MAG: aromatic hydrocarbon degradation protein, partial [Pseudomonadota bacterium]|nr:aromatic hydrocarbon degradation protein [Pseudomonadota bacterium]